VKLAKEFRRAIRQKEFEIYYQPQIDMKTEKLVGFEALIRWNHPEDGLLSPVNFLPAIEKANLLYRLDKWVMNHAMKEMVRWYSEGLNPGRLALNITMSELENSKWESKLMKIMSRLCFQPEWLEVEITETEIMKHPKRVISLLNTLRNHQIHIAIDDFGTGYSSLSQLKHLPFDKIKIDKVFIDDLPESHDAIVMFKTMTSLAQNMNIPVLAEGIETKEQADYLLTHGCQFAQGYYYAKPLSPKDAHAFLLKQKADHS
jgi:EAL domain-containing protein (putative c-di-GMP-specific phosphodiesterase class I)